MCTFKFLRGNCAIIAWNFFSRFWWRIEFRISELYRDRDMLSSTFRQDLKPRLHDEAINIFLSKIFSKDNFADEMSKLEMCNKNYLSSWAQVGLLKWSIFGGNDRARFAYSWPIQNTFKMVWKNKILKSTMFENDLKCLILFTFGIFHQFLSF